MAANGDLLEWAPVFGKSYGTPRPESQAIRAHVPAVFWSFANSWRDVFHTGVADHGIKELCRLYVSRSVLCEFCGNQRSIKAAKAGDVMEEQTKDLINFEASTKYSEKQKAALSYAEAITWDLPVDQKFWDRLHKHFNEPELVEIGYFIALTMGRKLREDPLVNTFRLSVVPLRSIRAASNSRKRWRWPRPW